MRPPLLLQFFDELPDRKLGDNPRQAARRIRRGLSHFKQDVEKKYNEATLVRLLTFPHPEVRQAAALALGLTGSMKANAPLAARLRDEDPAVVELAADALWALWFRADSPENNEELQRLMHTPWHEGSVEEVLDGFRALITKAPYFAEAYNQRAIIYFRLGEWQKSISDCEKALRLNPHHFGAASGLGQCFMKQNKYRAALRSYRRALRIHPRLEGVRQVIASLERMIDEK